jgi:hypothetical protein
MDVLTFTSSIVISIISGVATIMSAVIAIRYKHKLSKYKTEVEVIRTDLKHTQFQADGINALLDLQTFNKINNGIADIFAATKATRFLIMIAENGQVKPNNVSVIFQSVKHGGDLKNKIIINSLSQYHRIKVDKFYSEILDILEKEESYSFIVSEEPDQDLKGFYAAEGVKHSVLRWIDRRPKDDKNDILFFAAVSTHDGIYTAEEMSIIKACFGEIRSAVKDQFN